MICLGLKNIMSQMYDLLDIILYLVYLFLVATALQANRKLFLANLNLQLFHHIICVSICAVSILHIVWKGTVYFKSKLFI